MNEGISSMASSAQQWLLRFGVPNIYTQGIPAATEGEVSILATNMLFLQMYL